MKTCKKNGGDGESLPIPQVPALKLADDAMHGDFENE